MSETVRFGVSLGLGLLDRFDGLIRKMGYENRSEAIRDLIRDKLVHEQWEEANGEAFGVVFLVYDPGLTGLDRRLMEIQHKFAGRVVSTLHVHIDEQNCLEVAVLRGPGPEVRTIGNRLVSMRGVKFGRLNMGATGADLD